MKNEATSPVDSVPEVVPGLSTASVDNVLDAFHAVRASVATLLDDVGVDPTKTRESARILELNRGLAWRLTRLVRSPDAASVVSDVPGRQSMARFLDSCRRRGAPETSVSAALSAVEAFERAVDSCSGDRKTLAMVMANRSDRNPASEQERARRKLFEGACSVWGVQAQARFVTVFLFPSPDDPSMLDAGHVTGYVDFRRLSTKPWPMSYEAVHDASGKLVGFDKSPLDSEGSEEGELQLLTKFCKPAKPRIDVSVNDGMKRFDLAAGPVGNEGLTTCIFGSYLRKLYARSPDPAETAGFMVLLRTPIERVVFDFFIHKDISVANPARTMLLDRLAYPQVNRESDFPAQSLSISESPAPLPRGIGGAIHPNLPWYPKLLDFVTSRIEHRFEDFDGSRFEMTFPPISTTLRREITLPPR